MFREKKFHELIEKQNQEEKQRVWEKIKSREFATPARLDFSYKNSKDKWKLGRYLLISLSALIIIGVTTFTFIRFFPFNNAGTDNSSSVENKDRYCDSSQYDKVTTNINLQQYGQEIGKELLYFDWYEETDYLVNKIYRMKDTGEIICFTEDIVDFNTGSMISIWVTDNRTRVDVLDIEEEQTIEAVVKGVEIRLLSGNRKANAYFEYEDYRYYLQVEDPMEEDSIIEYVELLLP